MTPGAYSALRGVLNDHKDVSDDEKLHLMLQTLIDTDPTFKGSLRSSKSGRSQATERSEKSRSRAKSVDKSAGFATHSSLTKETLQVLPIAGCSRDQPNKLELTREWARMVETGGVSVKEGTSCYFRDSKGEAKFVDPPTVSPPEGGSLKQKLGSLALSAVSESSPSGGVASGIAKKVLQSQGSGGGVSDVISILDYEGSPSKSFVSPVPRVSPRERSVSPRRSLKRARGGGECLLVSCQATG